LAGEGKVKAKSSYHLLEKANTRASEMNNEPTGEQPSTPHDNRLKEKLEKERSKTQSTEQEVGAPQSQLEQQKSSLVESNRQVQELREVNQKLLQTQAIQAEEFTKKIRESLKEELSNAQLQHDKFVASLQNQIARRRHNKIIWKNQINIPVRVVWHRRGDFSE
jgi:hypothetical protein